MAAKSCRSQPGEFGSGGAYSSFEAVVLRIDERNEHPEQATLTLAGSLAGPYIDELRRICEEIRRDGRAVTLDLTELRSIDRAGVGFLRSLVESGARLAHCPRYMRRWLAEERRDRAGREDW